MHNSSLSPNIGRKAGFRTGFAIAILGTLLMTVAPGGAAPREVMPSDGNVAFRQADHSPVVVELFTSQGCSSCPAANSVLASLGDRPDVLPLSLGVTYWDYLGWKDTFGDPEFTRRQQDYVVRMGLRSMYTPQAVIDGATETVGSRNQQVERLIRERIATTARRPASVWFSVNSPMPMTRIHAPEGADVWLLGFKPGLQSVAVKAGENRGRTVEQYNPATSVKRVGRVAQGPFYAYLDACKPSCAVIVQRPNSGEIIGVGVTSLR